MEHITNNNIKGLIMDFLITKIKHTFTTRPSNAFLLFLTGFFFSQFMLINILYTKHPFGGWETSIGNFTNYSILITFLTILSICLLGLLRSIMRKPTNTNSLIFQTEAA